MRRRRRPPLDLMLVGTGMRYAPPLPIAEDPELAAAYERGRHDRATRPGREPLTDDDLESARGRARDWSSAYALGRFDDPPRAPAPLGVQILAIAAELAIMAFAERPPRLLRVPPAIAASVGLARLIDGLERRRARALGLTPLTAPRPRVPPQFALRLGLSLLLSRKRWALASPPVRAAHMAVAELERRRSFRAALR